MLQGSACVPVEMTAWAVSAEHNHHTPIARTQHTQVDTVVCHQATILCTLGLRTLPKPEVVC